MPIAESSIPVAAGSSLALCSPATTANAIHVTVDNLVRAKGGGGTRKFPEAQPAS